MAVILSTRLAVILKFQYLFCYGVSITKEFNWQADEAQCFDWKKSVHAHNNSKHWNNKPSIVVMDLLHRRSQFDLYSQRFTWQVDEHLSGLTHALWGEWVVSPRYWRTLTYKVSIIVRMGFSASCNSKKKRTSHLGLTSCLKSAFSFMTSYLGISCAYSSKTGASHGKI